jgi:thiol-disulfide isomerase/thioredoxin
MLQRLSFRAMLIAGLITNVCTAQQSLKIQPEIPKPGEQIVITYNSTGTELFGSNNPEAYAYLLEGALPLVKEIKLKKNGNIYTGDFTTNDTTKAVFLSFSKDDKKDNNGDKGYYTMLYKTNGEPVADARKSIGMAFSAYGGIWGLKRDPEVTVKLTHEELSANSSFRKDKPLEVAQGLFSSKEETDLALIKEVLGNVLSSPNSTEADLATVKTLYLNKFKDKDRAAAADSLMRKRFPAGTWVRNANIEKLRAERDPQKQEVLFEQLRKDFATGTEADKRTLNSMASMIAMNFSNAGNLQKAKEYAALLTDKSSLANLYNSIAWKETGESVSGKPGNVAMAKELSARSLVLVNEAMNEMKNKPPYLTDAQFKKNLEGTYNMYADTYALLLYHSKDYQEAYNIQKKAVEGAKRADVSMNEAFSVYTEKTNGPAAAKKELESFIKEGRYSPGMKEQLKTIYLSEKNTTDSWSGYIAGLEAASLERKKVELAGKMINASAPAFTLKDVNGNEVTLASLKGKVVVVDFWATWCGPCKASFPAMKIAVEKYKADKDVAFVFIDTWENGEKEVVMKNVTQFIEKNAYPFHVLMDTDSKVVDAFKVEGIPTKFVIDTNSKIRFKSVGFGGTTDGLVSELGMMIEMARNGGTGGTNKKAF